MQRTLSRIAATLVTALLLFAAYTLTPVGRASTADPFTSYLMAHFTGERAIGERACSPTSVTHSSPSRWRSAHSGSAHLLTACRAQGARQ